MTCVIKGTFRFWVIEFGVGIGAKYLCCALNVFKDLQFFDYLNIESKKKKCSYVPGLSDN